MVRPESLIKQSQIEKSKQTVKNIQLLEKVKKNKSNNFQITKQLDKVKESQIKVNHSKKSKTCQNKTSNKSRKQIKEELTFFGTFFEIWNQALSNERFLQS